MGNSASLCKSSTRNDHSSKLSLSSNSKNGSNAKQLPGTFTANNSNVMVFGTYLEPRLISKLSRQAKARRACDIKRVSLLSCSASVSESSSSLSSKHSSSKLILQMTKFLQTHAPNLEWLLITGHLLLETNAQACQLLKSTPRSSLKRLCITIGRPASTELGETLFELLQTSPNLEHLNLNGFSWFSVPALKILVPALPKLKWLDMTGCRISVEGFHLMVEALARAADDDESDTSLMASKLETLNLMSNALSSASLKDVALLVSKCSSLTSLNMSHMPLFLNATPADIEVLAQAIAQTTTLQELNLSFTAMSLPVMARILQAASESLSLTTLHLSGNRVTPREALLLVTQYLEAGTLRISSLYVQQQLPAPSPAPQDQEQDPQPPQDTHAEDEVESAFLRKECLQALRNHHHLTRLYIAENSDSEWSSQTKAILDRNLLTQRFVSMNSEGTSPVLGVWPQFLHHQTPALTYQVLQRYLISMMET